MRKYKIKTKSGKVIGEADSYTVVKYLVEDYKVLMESLGIYDDEYYILEFDARENKYKVKH